MRHPLRRDLLAFALLVTCSVSAAGQSSDPITSPPAGTWGAELNYYGSTGVSLIRFSSPRAAWLLGASFAIGKESADQPNFPATGTTRQSSSFTFGQLRAGRRWYTGDSQAKLRPISGLGLAGSYGSRTNATDWSAGGYGELGAAYFFTPHVSLGATSELSYLRSRQRQAVPGSGDFVQDQWTLRGNLVSITAAVYF